MIDTAELRRVIGAMTPGEWELDVGRVICPNSIILEFDYRDKRYESNAIGTAYLRNVAEEMADEIDRLRAALTCGCGDIGTQYECPTCAMMPLSSRGGRQGG